MSQVIDNETRSQFDVMMYRGEYYYRNTLPSRVLNRTKNGYSLFRVKNGRLILEVIE